MQAAAVQEVVLVIGVNGCVGAAVAGKFINNKMPMVGLDTKPWPDRILLWMSDDEWAKVPFVSCDLTQTSAEGLARIMGEHKITRVIHLAALQIPACEADPLKGMEVNVGGTLKIFEAARLLEGQIRSVTYASSVAVYGPPALYRGSVGEWERTIPGFLYGIWKMTGEHIARYYWQKYQIPSIGLRPHTIYGLGRDTGKTADITKALLAIAARKSYVIQFSGNIDLQYVEDVAGYFVQSALLDSKGAKAFNLHGETIDVRKVVHELLEHYMAENPVIGFTGDPLPFPSDLNDNAFRGMLSEHGMPDQLRPSDFGFGHAKTIRRFRELIAAGQIDFSQLER